MDQTTVAKTRGNRGEEIWDGAIECEREETDQWAVGNMRGGNNCFVSGKSEMSTLRPANLNRERNPSFPEIKNPLPLPKSVSSDKDTTVFFSRLGSNEAQGN